MVQLEIDSIPVFGFTESTHRWCGRCLVKIGMIQRHVPTAVEQHIRSAAGIGKNYNNAKEPSNFNTRFGGLLADSFLSSARGKAQ